jgi:hypothetical protein
MGKFQKVGSGFVRKGSKLINLKAYKEIENVGIAIDEHEPSGIKFTPIQPLKEDYENNVEGSFYYGYSKQEAEESGQKKKPGDAKAWRGFLSCTPVMDRRSQSSPRNVF